MLIRIEVLPAVYRPPHTGVSGMRVHSIKFHRSSAETSVRGKEGLQFAVLPERHTNISEAIAQICYNLSTRSGSTREIHFYPWRQSQSTQELTKGLHREYLCIRVPVMLILKMP